MYMYMEAIPQGILPKQPKVYMSVTRGSPSQTTSIQ